MSTLKSDNFIHRINGLRLLKQWTWEETADAVGLSRSMIHFIKSGKYGVTEKVLYRLAQAERAAGIIQVLSPEERGIIEEGFETQRMAGIIKVDHPDVKRGHKDIELEYRAGKAPGRNPKNIRVAALGSFEAAKLLPQLVAKKISAADILLMSIPKEYRNDSFLNQLTPACLSSIICAAIFLNYGLMEGRQILIDFGYKFGAGKETF